MKYYCLTCGKPTSYTLNLPKFCSECGVPSINTQFKAPSPDFYNKLKEQNTILPDRNPNNFEGGDNTNLQKSHRPPADPNPTRPRMIPTNKMSMATEEAQPEEGLLYPTNKFKVTIEGGRNQPQRQERQDDYEAEPSEDIDSEYFDTSKFKYIKPKFKIETFARCGESLEGLLTQGAMMNSRPEPIQYDGGPIPSQEQVLAEFQREAGTSRQK